KIPDARLCIDVELAERFDVITEKLRAYGTQRLPGKQIENSTAHRELPARRHLRDTLVAGGHERFDRAFHRFIRAAAQRQGCRAQRGWLRRHLVERGARRDDEMRTFLALDAA